MGCVNEPSTIPSYNGVVKQQGWQTPASAAGQQCACFIWEGIHMKRKCPQPVDTPQLVHGLTDQKKSPVSRKDQPIDQKNLPISRKKVFTTQRNWSKNFGSYMVGRPGLGNHGPSRMFAQGTPDQQQHSDCWKYLRPRKHDRRKDYERISDNHTDIFGPLRRPGQ